MMVQFCGVIVISNYAATIMGSVNSSLHPNEAVIITGVLALVASIIAIFLVEITGRRVNIAHNPEFILFI